MDSDELSSAIFSKDRTFRYALWRTWDSNKPSVMFIGLNPSIANEGQDDPTIRRVKKLAREWGFGKLVMTNLYAYISSHPADLISCSDPVGPMNDGYLKHFKKQCQTVVFAWGKQDHLERAEEVMRLFPNARCIGRNLDGSPKHPLYVRKYSQLLKWG